MSYDVNNDVSPEAWLTLDSCYLIGWNQKNARGDSGLNEQIHSDQNHRRHSHGDSHEKADGHHRLYDMLGFNATGPTRGHSHEKARENARGHSREWGRCLM